MSAATEQAVTAALGAAARGDERGWEAIVRRYTPMLRGVAAGYRLSPQDAEDVVQACWLALLVNLDGLREPEAVGGWLVTTARRLSMRALQRGAREILIDASLDEQPAAPECVQSTVTGTDEVRRLHEAVARLPGRQRRLLHELLAEPKRSYSEIAARLGMPIGSIGPTRERSLNRLRADAGLAAAMAG